MTGTDDRIFPLDVVRGAAVLGMALLTAGAIALPASVNLHPGLAGEGLTARLLWLATFVFLDGKMLGLFAILFGASALLVIDRAEMDGRDGFAVQGRRLLWLLPIGAVHYLLLWSGDCLILLAAGGLIALRFAGREPLDLAKWALAFFALHLLILASGATLSFLTTSQAAYAEMLQKALVHDMALYRSGYGAIAHARLAAAPEHVAALVQMLPETLGFMLLGMAMAMGGFFTGQWSREQYARTARHAYLVGAVPVLLLGIWAFLSDDLRIHNGLIAALAFPLGIPITIGHAALVMLIANRPNIGALTRRVAAVGRTALSNYLLCSIVLTTIFYGYGLGRYAQLGRITLFGVALGLCALMLLWSPHWLQRFGAGPAERMWHALRRIGAAQ